MGKKIFCLPKMYQASGTWHLYALIKLYNNKIFRLTPCYQNIFNKRFSKNFCFVIYVTLYLQITPTDKSYSVYTLSRE